MNTFASLFTGFGGADVGAFDAGFRPVWGVEFDPAIAAVAKLNGAHVLVDDVRRVNYAALPAPDLLHASPVCKNASIAKQNGGEAAEDIETAEARLGRYAARFVIIQPALLEPFPLVID